MTPNVPPLMPEDDEEPRSLGQSLGHRFLSILFEVFYWIRAFIAIPILAALVGFLMYAEYPSTNVLIGVIVAEFVAIVLGVLLAEHLRKRFKHRGGMAGAMATHATPDLDRDSSDENEHR